MAGRWAVPGYVMHAPARAEAGRERLMSLRCSKSLSNIVAPCADSRNEDSGYLKDEAAKVWDRASNREKFGYRNAQVTVLARPQISFLWIATPPAFEPISR